MELRQLINVIEGIASTKHAESWDNVGLLVGDPQQSITRVMLTIDYTVDVAAEARDGKCDGVISYHPPIFDAIKRITSDGPSSLIFDAIRRGVAIYSPHTALDVADGGTNDMLADAIGLPPADRKPLKLAQPKATQYKLVVFVPERELERVASAMFAAGAGRIGKYSSCSFRTPGTGTFFGEEGTNPAVGESGRLETAQEIRLETVVPISKVQAVIDALRGVHPYEEPAFDLNQLAASPEALGLGRIGSFAAPVPVADLIERIKRELEIGSVLVAGANDRPVRRAAVCAGACGNLLDDAIAQDADFYLTGEMRHHDAIKAASAGLTAVCTLHSNSERAVLKRLRERLATRLAGVEFILSQRDRDPFIIR